MIEKILLLASTILLTMSAFGDIKFSGIVVVGERLHGLKDFLEEKFTLRIGLLYAILAFFLELTNYDISKKDIGVEVGWYVVIIVIAAIILIIMTLWIVKKIANYYYEKAPVMTMDEAGKLTNLIIRKD